MTRMVTIQSNGTCTRFTGSIDDDYACRVVHAGVRVYDRKVSTIPAVEDIAAFPGTRDHLLFFPIVVLVEEDGWTDQDIMSVLQTDPDTSGRVTTGEGDTVDVVGDYGDGEVREYDPGDDDEDVNNNEEGELDDETYLFEEGEEDPGVVEFI